MAKRSNTNYVGVDLVGQRHVRLEVIRKADHGKTWWVCKCDCGNVVELMACQFFHNKSCGCFERENRQKLRDRTRTHGMTETRLYGIWCGIKDRCKNPNIEHYDRYGGRGIKICKEWEHSFEAFRDWAISAGYDETKTGKEQSIDRIDVNGDYCPENCRWISMKQQARNRSDTVFIETENGKTPVREFCEDHGITYEHFVLRHLERGYSLDEIIRIWNFKSGKHDGFYSLDEAALFYSVGTQSILHWIRDGKIKAEKVGRSWYIPHGQEINRREDRNELGQFLPGFSRPRGQYK